MKIFTLLFLLLSSTYSYADFPEGSKILTRVDQNMNSKTQVVTSKMVIHSRRDTRTIESKSWTQGTTQSYTEYLSPAREQGTKMLKLGDKLWMYSPSTDRIIQISGHMLRQSVMGSDLSYEDMMEDQRLSEIYDASITGTEVVQERTCWILDLVAKNDDVAYHSRKMWVDQDRYVPLKEELYAKSGKLLKKTDLKNFKLINDRWYPMLLVYKDVLKTGDGTQFIIDSIEFDTLIPAHLFSKAALRR